MAEPDDHGDEAFLRGGGATGELIAKHDWSATPLGPLNAWPPNLKTATAMVLRSRLPMALLWGPDGRMIYNDGYAAISGARHPQLLGAPVRDAWSEVAEFEDQVMTAVLGGETLEFRDQPLALRRGEKLEQRWFDLDYSPVLDESGEPAGVLAVVVETTQRMIATRKAADLLNRERRMFEQAPGFIALISGPTHVFQFVNEAHRRLFPHIEVGKSMNEVLAEFPQPGMRELFEHVYESGERFVGRAMPVTTPSAAGGPPIDRFIDFILQPVTDEDDAVVGLFVEGFDLTEQVRASAAVEETQRRLSAALAIARLGAYEWDLETREVRFDERAAELFGYAPGEHLTVEQVAARVDSRDLVRIQSDIGGVEEVNRGRRELEFRVHLPDGTTRDIVSVSERAPGPEAQQRMLGVFDDVTERRRAERRQRMLVNELNHRVKNTLATVQSIASQTLRSATDLPNARASFEARIAALAAAHDLLTKQSWHGADLGDVVASAMAPFEGVQKPQIRREGPPARLTAQRALALSLALHELATNAAKYGALSVPEGRVAVCWNVSGDQLTLSWIEEGGPRVTAPSRFGFGTRLLERSLARELNGEVTIAFEPQGVRCEIRCKLEPTRSEPTPEVADFSVH
jgi:two-component sensor histidine kinase/PAS domain-containing protein